MKRTILSLGVGSLVMGAIFIMAGCEACCPKPCKTEAKPVCASYRSTACNVSTVPCKTQVKPVRASYRSTDCNGSTVQQRNGSAWWDICNICGTKKTTYTRNGSTYSKCQKCP